MKTKEKVTICLKCESDDLKNHEDNQNGNH